MSSSKDFQHLWWPKFENLYEGLREAATSASSAAHANLAHVLQDVRVWLHMGLQGFQPPAHDARSFLEQETHLFVANGKKVPIKAELRSAAVLLSNHLGLNELQAYLLLYRSRALQLAGSMQSLSPEQLQDLQNAYFLQRNYLLSSIYELLSQQDTAEPLHQRSATTALSHALDAGLDKSLCKALAINLAEGRSDTSHDSAAIAAGMSSASNLSNSQHTETQSQQGKQQLLFEREMLLSTLLCMFADWKPCTSDCFEQLMHAMHQHMCLSRHTDKKSGAVTSRALQLMQTLSVQFVTIPALLSALGQGSLPSSDKSPLLVCGQDNLCQVFTSWLDNARQAQHAATGLTSAHGPAILAFAAAAALLKDMPDFSGPLADIDATSFANKAAQLEVLPTLAELTSSGQLSQASRITLLSLMCAAIAAFDLSPYSLSASQLQAMLDTLANLYEGQEELCAAFHDASKPDHFWHAPIRQFYQQTLELVFEDPKPVLRLWYSLACGLQSSDAVANMLENSVPPVMRATGSEKLSWLDEHQTMVQAMEDMAIPKSAGLTVFKGTTGRVLQKAQYLVEMEHAKHVKRHPLLASESTFLVLWLPSTYQRQPKQRNRVSSGDTEDRHLRPGNDILLGRAWACLRQIQQATEISLQCSEALTELLLVIKLFVRLAESRASIGHDLMRVKQVGEQCETQAGADALDLVCQVTDALCRMQRPSVELLGACIGLMSALARAFPGYAATLASKTYLLGDGDGRSHKAGSHHASLTSDSLPMLEHIQRVWEGGQGAYPVTLAFLGLTETLLIAGVNEACVKSYVGFTLSHILSSCHSWRYGKRSQRWDIITAALQVLHAVMTCPLVPQAGPSSKDWTQPDWSVAQAVAEAVSKPGHPAAYLFINLPPHADFLETLVKRQGREAEAASLERMTAQWLLLLPLLIQACKCLPYPSAFLQDLFQAPAEGKPSAANILASYIAYPFEEVKGKSMGAVALEAGQALAVAASAVSQGQVSLARCFLQGSSGDAGTCPVLEALARCFQYEQAVDNPLAFSAAAELLITAFTAPHPSLLVLLMIGSSVEEATDKENSSQLGNLGANKALPSAKKAPKKDSRPTCLDGLWEILQHAEELLQSQPDVMAHTLHLLAVMWQSGEVAALPTAMLRRQPEFLTLVAACIQQSGPKWPDVTCDTTKSDGERVNDLVDVWQQNVSMAWCLVAESHALTILAIEAFAQPRQQGAASQADVWALLDEWGSNKDAKGLLAASLERYTAPLWGPVASQASGLSQASILTQELYLEAETKLVFMFAFMAHFEADDLAKHTSGHTLLAALWQKVSPLLVAHCRNRGLDPSLSMQAVLEDLGQALVKREPSSADWKELAASACQYRDLVSSGEDTHLTFHGDAQMVLLLHDIRQLHLTDALLQAGTAHHCSTLSRVYGDNYLYDEVQLEDLVGELMVQRTSTGTLQAMLRACSVMGSVQDAQVHAMQALSMLSTTMARSIPAMHPPALPTSDSSHTLICLETALRPLLFAATKMDNEPTLWATPGLDTRVAHYAIALSTAQIMHSQLRHWKPKQAPSPPSLPASAVTPDKQHRPPKSKPAPSRLAQMSSACFSDSHKDAGWPPQLAVAEQLLSIARSWLVYQRIVAPVSLDTTSSEPITQSLLASLLLVLRRIGLTSPSSPPAHAHHQSQQALHAAAHNLLPELCRMAASLGCHAGLAASLIPLMMRSCHLSPSGSMPVISRHLHLVQAMYHAFHVRSVALREHHSQARQPPGASEATPGAMAERFVSANADLEGTLEGSLLAMALHVAQHAPGAQMLLDEGVAELLPALAKWLLSPDGADLMAAAVIIEQGTAQDYGAMSGRGACAELTGMYNRHGHRSPAHQQWCALMSLSGALVRSIERVDRLDKGIVTLLVVAQERMLAVLTPPDSAQQPLTLALLQEVEKVLFLASSVPHLKGQWQMASQGPSQGPGPGSIGGPLAMRQASCVFLEFAAVAVHHHNQPPCCPPISPYERSLASTSPQLPIAEAWFKAAAVGSAPQEQPLMWQGPHGSIDQAPVSATGYSCQVAETMYSCIMLALKLLKAFCPEAGPHQFSQIGLGWPSPAVLKALQKQCHAMAHTHIPEGSRRAISLIHNIQASLKLSWLLLGMLPAQIEDSEQKDYSVTSHKLQSILDKQWQNLTNADYR